MKESPVIVIVAFILIVVVGIGGWYVKRWFNWKYGYETSVAQQIEPLEKRIVELEKRVEKLEQDRK